MYAQVPPRRLSAPETKIREITRARGRIFPEKSHNTSYAASLIRLSDNRIVEITKKDGDEVKEVLIYRFHKRERWTTLYGPGSIIPVEQQNIQRRLSSAKMSRLYDGQPFSRSTKIKVYGDKLILEITESLEWSGDIHVYEFILSRIDDFGRTPLPSEPYRARHSHILYTKDDDSCERKVFRSLESIIA